MTGSAGAAPLPDAVASAVFGAGLPLAIRYAQLLADAGVVRGLIGPRERERLWDRHLVNSALISQLLPDSARVVDIGSGAGLPGLALACRRADLQIDLVESMQRRAGFLENAVDLLELTDRVRVIQGRAEAASVRSQVGSAEWVTARAVAPLDRLAAWSLPLLRRGGRLLAIKGDQADNEVQQYAAAVRAAGGVIEEVVQCGAELSPTATTVVVVRRD